LLRVKERPKVVTHAFNEFQFKDFVGLLGCGFGFRLRHRLCSFDFFWLRDKEANKPVKYSFDRFNV